VIRADADRELAAFCADHRTALLEIGEELAPAMAALEAMLAGGKRLRPTFCYWGWRGAGGAADDERIVRAAASLEFLQACALIHDDVIDNSDTRRGAGGPPPPRGGEGPAPAPGGGSAGAGGV
jgi:geranylgeranyl diphosphate synthase type I